LPSISLSLLIPLEVSPKSIVKRLLSGTNKPADALRVALLGIGAVHQAFLLARAGGNHVQTAAMFQYASNLRDTGKDMVRAAVEGGGVLADAALGAATSLATIDIFFGGGEWQDNFNLAKEMIAW